MSYYQKKVQELNGRIGALTAANKEQVKSIETARAKHIAELNEHKERIRELSRKLAETEGQLKAAEDSKKFYLQDAADARLRAQKLRGILDNVLDRIGGLDD